MKNSILFILVILMSSWLSAKPPQWVSKRPVEQLSFLGIGVAKKTEPDYMQVAKQRALSDLTSEIKVEVSSQSLLETLEINSQLSSNLMNSIQVSSKENLEDYEVVDSWEDKKEYWVYYRLSKAAYEMKIMQKKMKVTQDGYTFWIQGLAAQANGNTTSAINLFIKGLEVIEPAINEELIAEHNGSSVNVGNELYSSLQKVFNGISIEVSAKQIYMLALQPPSDPIKITVARDGVPLANIKLNFSFVTGSGSLSSNNVTDKKGEIDLYIQSVTSKLNRQEIKITMDPFAFREFKSPFYENVYRLFASNLPSTTIFIEQEKSEMKTYIKNVGNIDPTLASAVNNMLSNNFFTVVRLPEEATTYVLVASEIKKGGILKGDLYNSVEYFTDVEIQLIDAQTSNVLLSFSTNNRSLARTTDSESAAKNNAIREVMRKVNRSFEKELQKMSR